MFEMRGSNLQYHETFIFTKSIKTLKFKNLLKSNSAPFFKHYYIISFEVFYWNQICDLQLISEKYGT